MNWTLIVTFCSAIKKMDKLSVTQQVEQENKMFEKCILCLLHGLPKTVEALAANCGTMTYTNWLTAQSSRHQLRKYLVMYPA